MDFFGLEIDYLTILLAFYTVAGAYLIFRWSRNRDKMLVRIKYAKEKKMLVAPEGDTVKLGEQQSLGKGKGSIPAWRVKFTMACLYFSGWPFKRLTIDVMPDAKEAIPYFADLTPDKIPKWTRKEHEEYAQLDVLRSLRSLGEQKTSIVMWIIIVLIIIDIALPFLMGRIRF